MMDLKEIEELGILLELYNDVKVLYIQSEECVPDLKLFLAPLIEERDALDHLMEAFKKNSKEELINEIKKAQSHLLRAYFDIADYVCVIIRKYINEYLAKLKEKQIATIWEEYGKQKMKMYEFSKRIAEIRSSRRDDISSLDEYKDIIVPGIFEIYKDFISNIEARIRIKKKSSF